MATSTNLVVPVVLWGKTAPTHCISSIYVSPDQRTLVTGCYDGQLCLWEMDPCTLKMTPRCLMVGHTAQILCLTRASITANNMFLVSSSETGEMCTWDLVDGKCVEFVKLAYVHINMQAYHMASTEDLRLFCNGYYSEVLVMDPFTLEILFALSSRMNPDWISAMHVLRPNKQLDDIILALTTMGTIKTWTLTGQESHTSEPIYENESKQIRCLNALHLTCCAYNQRTVMIVCAKYWQIYDAADFFLLSSVTAPVGERWLGGEFVAADRVMIWSDDGRGYIYKLPTNCIVENKEFRTKTDRGDDPFLYCIVAVPGDKPLSCPPAMLFHTIHREGHVEKYLLRGDSKGNITIWGIPEVSNNQLAQICQEKFDKPPEMPPKISTNLQQAWDEVVPHPVGILDQLDTPQVQAPKLTASIYLPLQGRLVCGRDDGSIIIVPATQTVMLQLLHGKHQQYDDWPPHQLLLGHNGRVNCLLYPHHIHPRYEVAHLVSGGIDFSVCLWDVYSGAMLHRFCVHAGEITQLLVPPNSCTPRILQCICSVASDHSVTLLSLKDRKCVVLASRHLFPVTIIKWRPLDDFMIVGCSDGSVYVWQLETGHLDRVMHGMNADEVLSACDEHATMMAATDSAMANPAVHFFRGLRHRNLAAIRHAAQRGFHQLQQPQQNANQDLDHQKSRAYPLMIQGLRTNPKDAQSHILFFDIEALNVQLLTEEYTALSPSTLEAQGLINPSEYQKIIALTQSASPDAQKKIAEFFGKVKGKAGDMERILKEKDKHGLLAKMKEGAESVQLKIQAKAESVGFKNITEGNQRKGSQNSLDGNDNTSGRKPKSLQLETNIPMEIAQLLLSLLHAWGLEEDLDRVCESKLGLLRPMVPSSFGILSRGGYMSLQLPTWHPPTNVEGLNLKPQPKSYLEDDLPPEMLQLEKRTRVFTARGHWELSTTMTTNHLLAIIALSNTLMSMNNATFILEQERARKMHRPTTRARPEAVEEDAEDQFQAQQAQIKQGWSLLATLHCVLLPDKVQAIGALDFKKPQVEILARRWQDRCLEVREAAQALLLAELGRFGPRGRKNLVDEWAQYLPTYQENYPTASSVASTPGSTTATVGTVIGGTPSTVGNTTTGNVPGVPGTAVVGSNAANTGTVTDMIPSVGNVRMDGSGGNVVTVQQEDEEDEEDDGGEDMNTRRQSSSAEMRRKQATSIVLLGVIGAEFGQDIEPNKRKSAEEQKRKRSGVEGFSLGNNNLARLTSRALMHLLLCVPSKQQVHSPLRRAAIDLIGRGFTVWEAHLDVTRVLLALLDLCCDSDRVVASMSYGLPLTPAADSCRTARHALTLIATARPAAFVTTMAKEVARYNTLQQNAQTLNVNLVNSVLNRAKPEILRVIELLIDKMQGEIVDLLVEVMDIILHCLDPGHLKMKGLSEVFPAVCRFHQVNHCPHTRRIAVGAKNGSLSMYELRSGKCQSITAHGMAITACAFSPDGKFLASYACGENRLSFWQTSTGMFGLGTAQTRCVKTYSTSPIPDIVRMNPLRMARLVWISSKTVTLMLSDGTETRFSV